MALWLLFSGMAALASFQRIQANISPLSLKVPGSRLGRKTELAKEKNLASVTYTQILPFLAGKTSVTIPMLSSIPTKQGKILIAYKRVVLSPFKLQFGRESFV